MHVEQWFKHVLNLPELIGISTKVHVHCVEPWFKHVLNLPEFIGISTKVHVYCVEPWFKQLNFNVLIGAIYVILSYLSGVRT